MEEVFNFLKESGAYYLATMDGEQPRVRPFGTVAIFENHLYIQTGKSKDVFKQIEKNPRVEICAFNEGKWEAKKGYEYIFPQMVDIGEKELLPQCSFPLS